MNIDEITSGPLESPSDMIDLEESFHTANPQIPILSSARSWAFRGQSQSFGTLFPSFQRIFGGKRSPGTAEVMESDLIRTFREHYAKLEGRTLDMPQPHLINEDFPLRCLSVMQHYGVPTRLLDWTTDFWTAVYFACAGDPSKEAELWYYNRDALFYPQRIDQELGALLDPINNGQKREPVLLQRNEIKKIVEFDPRITPRMLKQSAHHTLCTDVFIDHAVILYEQYKVELAHFANLPEPLEIKNHPFLFRRVLIKPGCKEKALRYLADQRKITASTIFPDVEGLNKFLHWHLESLVTTLL
ncbi:MAG: FRG domain-containing protein [Bacteroidetes bacterium]|nr:MAG: FRG domain-containing protein [Bacteroidota bacterium]